MSAALGTHPTQSPPSRPVHMPVTAAVAEPPRWLPASVYVARWRERQEGA